MVDWCLEGAEFGLLIGEFCYSYGCQDADAEHWVLLLDFNSLSQEALQLSLCPSHLWHDMAIVCHDY